MTIHVKPQVVSVDAAIVEKWLRQDSVVLVDVRETSEFDQEHIPGALLQPMSVFDPELFPSVPGKKVVLHCAVGKRSEAAGKMLLQQGHENVLHMSGGIKAWKLAGFETEEQFIPPAPEPADVIETSIVAAGSISNGVIDLATSSSPADVLLEEFMQPLEIDAGELAIKIGTDVQTVQAILEGAAPVTAELSLRLARYFCTADDFWLNLQLKSDLERATALHGQSVYEGIVPRLCN